MMKLSIHHIIKILLIILPYLCLGLIWWQYIFNTGLSQANSFRSYIYLKDILIGICFAGLLILYVVLNKYVSNIFKMTCTILHLSFLSLTLIGILYFHVKLPEKLYFFILSNMTYIAIWIGVFLTILIVEMKQFFLPKDGIDMPNDFLKNSGNPK